MTSREDMGGGEFPRTRYQGSKVKLLHWIWEGIAHLDFHTCLDLFSGTASVSHLFKKKGKQVTANDYLRCNQIIAQALVVNEGETLESEQAKALFQKAELRSYDSFIEHNFEDIFFLTDENAWLDLVAQNIALDLEGNRRALALFALFQSCLAKRPYNLFHRANLYMRTAEVKRNFGNKATWDKSFPAHFLASLEQANAAVFESGLEHRALCGDFLQVEGAFDLVYMDPPYLNAKGTGVDYLDFYHFLEGLTDYQAWPKNLSNQFKHKPFHRRENAWNSKERILGAFDAALEKYRDAIVVISYRNNGIPSVEELTALLARHGRKDATAKKRDYQYVLSNQKGKEVLLVSEP